jgi:hypothetical protein
MFVPLVLIALLGLSCIYDFIGNNIKKGITAEIIKEIGVLALVVSIVAPLLLSGALILLFLV